MKSNKHYNLILISLLCITGITVLLQVYALNKTLLLTPNNTENTKIITDKANGGTSDVSFIIHDNKWQLDCTINTSSYRWPFCELAIHFFTHRDSYHDQGVDLSKYNHVEVKANYRNARNQSIRFQLRTFNDKFSTMMNENSWKYVGTQYWLEDNQSSAVIPMSSLQVPAWWLLEQKIPIALSSPEFGKTLVIEVATGNNIQPGKYTIDIEHIKFTGKYFSNGQVFFTVIMLWVSAACFVLYNNIIYAHRKLHTSQQKASELKQLNKLLNVETQTLKDKAERDPLTGAFNRSGIQAIFTKEIKILSLIFIDIDHFKKINDTYGHAVGDDILKEFTKTLNRSCRNTDFLARWGGEEFLLICPNTVLSDAFELAQTLRGIVRDKIWTNDIRMTSSFGVAQRGDESQSDFIERADKALYDAKARGRDQVVLSKLSNRLNESFLE